MPHNRLSRYGGVMLKTPPPHPPATVPAYIGLGSNLGDRGANILSAVAELGKIDGVEVVQVSSMMDNPAAGGPENSPAFMNAAAEIETSLGSHSLMDQLMEIERKMGRVRRLKWEPRIIDLDLLLYDDAIVSTDELMVPHPLMHERKFVLVPMAEIAPDAVHPAMRMTMKGLLEDLLQREQCKTPP
jgi:2-amino-4-hydroxy-6-hydroxymethyldihydropteridine diphosphokinase